MAVVLSSPVLLLLLLLLIYSKRSRQARHSDATKPHTSTERTLNSSLCAHIVSGGKIVLRWCWVGVGGRHTHVEASGALAKVSHVWELPPLKSSLSHRPIVPLPLRTVSTTRADGAISLSQPQPTTTLARAGYPPTERKSSPESWTKLLAPVHR